MALLRDVDVDGPGYSRELGFGYGGLVAEYRLGTMERFRYAVSGLLGAGSAELEDLVVGTELGSDNFLVFEAGLVARASVFSRAGAGVSLGYRLVAGVDDLPGVGTAQLRGFTLSLSLRVGPFS